MPYEFKFPDVGEGIHEGEIVKWFVKEGDNVGVDEPLGQIETDKALVDIPSPKAGKILKLHVKAGGTIKVGEVMVTILEKGEKPGKKKEKGKKSGEEHYTGSVVGFLEEAKGITPVQASQSPVFSAEKEILAAPAARALAKQLNINLANVQGTGLNGMITIHDVGNAVAGRQPAQAQQAAQTTSSTSSGIKVSKKYDFFGYVDRVKLHGVRKAVAEKMITSSLTTATLTNFYGVDVTSLVELREKEKIKYEKQKIKLTYMPYIVKAVTACFQKHPYLNASLEGDEIILKKYYNIGIAVDTKDGLMVPVVKGADKKDIKQLAKEIEELAEQARKRKLNLMDLRGGTFTITNIGNLSAGFFTPIINYPESAILGVGMIKDKPAVISGKIEIRKYLPLSLSYDHRIVDGAAASRFINDVVSILERAKF